MQYKKESTSDKFVLLNSLAGKKLLKQRAEGDHKDISQR